MTLPALIGATCWVRVGGDPLGEAHQEPQRYPSRLFMRKEPELAGGSGPELTPASSAPRQEVDWFFLFVCFFKSLFIYLFIHLLLNHHKMQS